jgi:HSP90 family molecular chaperone
VNADDIDLGDSDAEGEALPEAETTTLCDWIKERLTAQRVDTVRTGKRLVGSPALVLTPEGEMTPQMRQMMKALGKDGACPARRSSSRSIRATTSSKASPNSTRATPNGRTHLRADPRQRPAQRRPAR